MLKCHTHPTLYEVVHKVGKISCRRNTKSYLSSFGFCDVQCKQNVGIKNYLVITNNILTYDIEQKYPHPI